MQNVECCRGSKKGKSNIQHFPVELRTYDDRRNRIDSPGVFPRLGRSRKSKVCCKQCKDRHHSSSTKEAFLEVVDKIVVQQIQTTLYIEHQSILPLEYNIPLLPFEKMSTLFLFACILCLGFATAYSPNAKPSAQQRQQHETASLERRGFFAQTIVMATAVAFAAPKTAGAVISSKYCAFGEGNDCEDLAEGNAYILELQRKSAANRKANEESAKNAFYAKNYPDWFAAVGKTMVQKESDGTFILLDDAELNKLRAQGKITVKIPSAMGGRVTDVTQKPTLVLKDEGLTIASAQEAVPPPEESVAAVTQ